MKSFYSKQDFTLTGEGIELDLSTLTLLRPLFKLYIEAGYSPREIGHIMGGAVTELELSSVLDRMFDK